MLTKKRDYEDVLESKSSCFVCLLCFVFQTLSFAQANNSRPRFHYYTFNYHYIK